MASRERNSAWRTGRRRSGSDRLWKKIEAGAPELFMAWRDCGLLDEEGRPRPALGLWQAWFALPLRE